MTSQAAFGGGGAFGAATNKGFKQQLNKF